MSAAKPPTEEQKREWFARSLIRFDESPMHRAIGLEMLGMSWGEVELRLTCPPDFRNAHGTIHGGLLMTSLDSAVLQSVRSNVVGHFGQSTIELKANFMRPAVNASVRVFGTALHVGRTTGVARAVAVDDEGRTIAAALGTIHIAPRAEAT